MSRKEKIHIRNEFILKRSQALSDFKQSIPNVSMTQDIPNFRVLYSKGIPHSDNKNPDQQHYQMLIDGIRNKDLSKIIQVSTSCQKLADVYCIMDKEFIGLNKSSYKIENTPSPLSKRGAAELIELYNMSSARDVLFSEWTTSSIIQNVLTSMNLVKEHLQAPMENGQITINTLFRGPTTGDRIGPYVSQFLYYPVQIGALPVQQKYQSPDSTNFMTSVQDYLNIWNGGNPSINPLLSGPTRYLLQIIFILIKCGNHSSQRLQFF
jgi:hypothetical protein